MALVQFSAVAEYFKGFFLVDNTPEKYQQTKIVYGELNWSHSANLSWASVTENGLISL